MTNPETSVPIKPDDKITTSTTGRDVIFEKVLEKALPGSVKYSPNVLSPIIKDITNG